MISLPIRRSRPWKRDLSLLTRRPTGEAVVGMNELAGPTSAARIRRQVGIHEEASGGYGMH